MRIGLLGTRRTWALAATSLMLGLLPGCRSCRPDDQPVALLDAGSPPAASTKGTKTMPVFVEIVGPASAFAGLASVAGVMLDDHARHTLPDGRWRVATYVSSIAMVDRIQALGLDVEVRQTAEQVQAELQRIANDVNDGGTSERRTGS